MISVAYIIVPLMRYYCSRVIHLFLLHRLI